MFDDVKLWVRAYVWWINDPAWRRIYKQFRSFDCKKIPNKPYQSNRTQKWITTIQSHRKNQPYALQQFLYRERYSTDKLYEHLQMYVNEKLGETKGILVVDKTGFLKQGKRSCGVKRQYSGTTGRIENCQIRVFLTYTSSKGHTHRPTTIHTKTLVWRPCSMPESRNFQKQLCSKQNLKWLLKWYKIPPSARISYTWVTGDCVYGGLSNHTHVTGGAT